MKKLKKLKYIALFALIISFTNCSQEPNLEIINETGNAELDETKASAFGYNLNLVVTVTYTFDPWLSESEKELKRVKFRKKMNYFYKIYTYQPTNNEFCDKEGWTVNRSQYFDYLSSNYFKGAPGGTGDVVAEDDPEVPDCRPESSEPCTYYSTKYCFSDNLPIIYGSKIN